MVGFKLQKLSKGQKALRCRILELSYRASYSHLGSCLSSIDLIDAIYRHKKKNEIFVLSNGHAGVALYVVLEKYGLLDKKITESLSVHPDRNSKIGIDVSTGSLGQGLPIALGFALSNRTKNVYCLISDGECNEGSIWESLRLAVDLGLENLKIIVNANGWGAYDPISLLNLAKRMKAFNLHMVKVNGHDSKALIRNYRLKTKGKPLLVFAETRVEQLPFLKGQDAHYFVMKSEDFSLAMELLK